MRRCTRIVALAALLAPIAVLISPTPASAAEPARDITEFACAGGSSPFADTAGSTHEASIACIVSYGLASGTTATTFSPGRPVTRGQMATFLANFVDLVGVPLGDGSATPSDVPIGPRVYSDVDGNTHEENINYVTDLGIAEGTSATTFSPNLAVTRGQMATFLVRTMDFLGFTPPSDPSDAFTDDDGGAHEATTNVVAALGIAQGTSPGAYQPRSAVARGAMATFLARMLDLGIEVGFAYPNITSEALAALNGTSVTPGPGASGVGTAYLATTDVDDVLCFQIDGLSGATEIHVHQGAAGANGPTVATIAVPPGDTALGCTKSEAAAAVAAAPDDFYVDVHTAAFPGGAIRGQLGSIVTSASGEMGPDQVVPGPGSSDVFGIGQVVTTSQPDVVCVQAFLIAFDDTINALHLHQGALHSNGSLVLDVPVTPSELIFVAHCVVNPIAASVASGPSDFYFDAHTAAFPDGAVRGQLGAD